MKIRPRTNPSGQIVWELDHGLHQGKRLRETYHTQEAAEKALAEAQLRRERHGDLANTVTATELANAVIATDRLRDVGATLQEAVEYFLANANRVRDPLQVHEAISAFLSHQKQAGKSTRSLQTWRCSLRPFADRFGTRQLHTITDHDLKTWLRSHHWAPRTTKNRIADLRTLFRWAQHGHHIKDDPTTHIITPRPLPGEIGILRLEQAEKLLRTAQEPEHRRTLPYIILGLFCGIRRAELERISWANINLTERTVIIGAATSKTRSRRVVDIPKNAIAWLRLIKHQPTDRITPGDHRDSLKALRQAAGIDAWPHNALRHTYASMHYAHHQNEAMLQVQMGHESAAMLHRHYRAVCTRADAAAYWRLRPKR